MKREVTKREENRVITAAKETDERRLKDAIMLRWDSKKPDEITEMKKSHSEKQFVTMGSQDEGIEIQKRDRSSSISNPYKASVSDFYSKRNSRQLNFKDPTSS